MKNPVISMVRLAGFEPATLEFVVLYFRHAVCNIRMLCHAGSHIVTMTCYILATLLFLPALTGCGNYKEYAAAKTEFAVTEGKRMEHQSTVVLAVAKMILDGFGETVKQEPSPLYSKKYVDEYGNDVIDTVFDTSGRLVDYLMAQKRVEVFKFILPFIEKVYQQQQLEMQAPVDAGRVALAFVNQIPLMTTVAGMYGLGKVGIENAGDHITAYASAGGSIATGGTATGVYQPITTTTTETTETVKE